MSTITAVTTNLDTLTQAHDAWVRAVGDAAEALDNLSPGGLGDRLREASMKYEEAVAAVLGETKQDLAVAVLRELLKRMDDEHTASTAFLLPSLSDGFETMSRTHMQRRQPIEQTIGELLAWKEDEV